MAGKSVLDGRAAYASRQCRRCACEFSPLGSRSYYCSDLCKVLDSVIIEESGCWAFGKKTKCNVGYSMVYADQKMVLVHRWLYQKVKGVTLDRTQELDHVVCSNRGCVNPGHLRVTDHASNAMRRLKSVNNASGYKGVSWHKGVKKWTAQIRCSGKGRHIGYYADPISAARAYDREAIRLFGRENSILNFPGES